MFEYLYEWISNIAYYIVLMTAVIQVIPNQTYKKYIRFFSGMILILLLTMPILKLFGMEDRLSDIYTSKEYEFQIKEIEESTKYLQEIEVSEFFPEKELEESEELEQIEVKEVQIGE